MYQRAGPLLQDVRSPALGVIPDDDTELLMACTSSLLQESLFKVSTIGGEAAFKAVKRGDAARYGLYLFLLSSLE